GKVDQAEWDKSFGTFLNKGGLSCCELTDKGGKIEASLKWMVTKSTPYIPSVLVVEGKVYAINDGGVLVALDADSGEQIHRVRLGNASGQYYASPVTAGGRMVLANLDGKVSLVRTADLKVLGTLDMEEQIAATPCIVDGRLVIRTQQKIYCFGRS
ncbi:MAG: PQQ-binding-like beta-propeller repeat protein, partial [Pirellulales bacterium]